MSGSIKQNYFYSVFFQILSFVVPFVTIPYLSRIFGADGLGVYSYTSSIAHYFLLFAMLGLNNYGVRTIARVREDKEGLDRTFSEIFTMQFCISVLVVAIYLLFAFCWTTSYTTCLIILTLYTMSSLFDVNWYFFGVEKFKITVIRNSVIKLISVILIFLLIKKQEDVWIYILIHSLSTLFSAIVLWPYLLKDVSFIRPSRKDVLKHIKPNIVMFVPVVAISVYKYMDKIMLGNYSIVETGYYENVEKMLTVVLGLITAFGTVMLPRISNLVANQDYNQVNKYMLKSMNFVMFLSVGMVCGLYAVSSSFVPLFFGDGFTPCVLIMRVLAISTIFSSWANVIRTQYLIPFQKDNVYVISVVTGAVLNFVGNIILIPKIGAMGAVCSTILAEFAVAFIQTIIANKQLPCLKMILASVPYIAIGVLMILLLTIFDDIDNMFMKLLIEVVVGMIFYSACSYVYYKVRNGLLAVKI